MSKNGFKKNTGEQNDKPKRTKGASKKCLGVLDFTGMTQDGTIVSADGKSYSRLYSITETDAEAMAMDDAYEALTESLKQFPDNVDISFMITNKQSTMQEVMSKLHLKKGKDALDDFRTDYNACIDAKLQESGGSVTKCKFIVLTAYATDLQTAEGLLSTACTNFQNAVKGISSAQIRQVDAVTRLALMRTLLCGDSKEAFEMEFGEYFDGSGGLNQQKLKKAKLSVKDLAAPADYAKDKKRLQLSEQRFCKSFAFPNLPVEYDMNFLTKITNLPYEMVTVVTLRSVPRKKYVKQTAQNQSEPEKVSLGKDTQGTKLFFGTITATLFADSEEKLTSCSQQLITVCKDFSITPSQLFGQQEQGLSASLCIGSKVIIDQKMNTENIFMLLPFHVQNMEDENGHFYGVNAVSKNLIMYDRRRSQNANGFMCGNAGSGMAFMSKAEMMFNLLESKDDVIVIDPEEEYSHLTRSFLGSVIRFTLDSDTHLNPCDLYMDWDETPASLLSEKTDFIINLVETFLERACSSGETAAIKAACRSMYEPYLAEMTRRCEEGDKRSIDAKLCPTLANFYEELLNAGNADSNQLAMAIEPYCVGQYSFLAHHTNVRQESRFTVYNLLKVPEKLKKAAIKTCLVHTWARLMEKQNADEGNIWIYMDEIETLLDTDSSARYLTSYFRRIRKYRGIATGIAKDASDIFRNASLWNSAGFFMFTHQSPVSRQELQKTYSIPDALMDYLHSEKPGIGLLYNDTGMLPIELELPAGSELYKSLTSQSILTKSN